ncbi:hypothetical protein NPIL_81641 [Nephila pilipes]|uniref:Uncharacterized protein n=1 Tax=Nephila pilipes TaxID=299642 RepID=A0A8X6QLU9_NEPPI|nr:hypothetical protein NPIL_81641 [Nephila pilipes]
MILLLIQNVFPFGQESNFPTLPLSVLEEFPWLQNDAVDADLSSLANSIGVHTQHLFNGSLNGIILSLQQSPIKLRSIQYLADPTLPA